MGIFFDMFMVYNILYNLDLNLIYFIWHNLRLCLAIHLDIHNYRLNNPIFLNQKRFILFQLFLLPILLLLGQLSMPSKDFNKCLNFILLEKNLKFQPSWCSRLHFFHHQYGLVFHGIFHFFLKKTNIVIEILPRSKESINWVPFHIFDFFIPTQCIFWI